MQTNLIKDLTETEILSAIRERFEGEHVTAIALEPLIDKSQTLEELYDYISQALAEREPPLTKG